MHLKTQTGSIALLALCLAVSACSTPYQAPDYSHLSSPAEIRTQCRSHADEAAASSSETVRRGVELASGNPYQYPDEKYFAQCLKANKVK